jgi:LPS-assembly protein
MRFHPCPGANTVLVLLVLWPALAAAQAAEGLQLKLDRRLSPPPRQLEREAVRFLEADRIEGDRERGIVATGNVMLRQRGASIRADRVDYAETEQTAIATGDVRLEREGDTATGPRLTYHLDTETGEMERPVIALPRKEGRRVEARGQAERALLEGKDRSRLLSAEYTSCPAPRDDWFLRVRELELDTGRNVGTAYNTTVYFLGVPILYSPFLTFPLDNERRSGFLAPTLGSSGQSGFEVAVPYYWNIAPNRDATLTPKVYTKRGLQLGGEMRYLEGTFSGQLDGEYLPQDRIADRDRYFVGLRHVHSLPFSLTASLAAQKVSDDDYFRDLSTRIAATSQTNLPRDAILAYRDENWALSARAISYQTLVDPLAPPVSSPYRILPQLLAAGERLNWRGLDLQFSGELSNFRHPSLVNGQRLIVNPSLQAPWRRPWGYVTPRVGWHYTEYRVDENTSGVEEGTRSVPMTSVDAGLFFDRPWEFRGERFVQTLEPRVFYLHVPYRDQSRLPNFTTAETDFNFAQMFLENRFIGGDRIGDANQLTLALTTRFVDADTGLERVKAALGQVHYFEPQRVTLEGPPRDQQRSDLLGVVSARWSRAVSADASVQYSPSRSETGKGAIGLRYHPEPGRVLNAAYRYAKDAIQQVDFSAQWPIGAGFTGVARANYSLKDSKLLEGLVGFEYNKGCWQLRAVAHRFITATQQVSTSFQIQLELAGLSRIGINPLETLRQNIAGYRRSDEIAP